MQIGVDPNELLLEGCAAYEDLASVPRIELDVRDSFRLGTFAQTACREELLEEGVFAGLLHVAVLG